MANKKRADTFFDQLCADCFEMYSEKMQKIFADEELIFEEPDLLAIHKTTMDESLALVRTLFFQLKKKPFNSTTNIKILYFILFFSSVKRPVI